MTVYCINYACVRAYSKINKLQHLNCYSRLSITHYFENYISIFMTYIIKYYR